MRCGFSPWFPLFCALEVSFFVPSGLHGPGYLKCRLPAAVPDGIAGRSATLCYTLRQTSVWKGKSHKPLKEKKSSVPIKRPVWAGTGHRTPPQTRRGRKSRSTKRKRKHGGPFCLLQPPERVRCTGSGLLEATLGRLAEAVKRAVCAL